jgi:hypothetical protein
MRYGKSNKRPQPAAEKAGLNEVASSGQPVPSYEADEVISTLGNAKAAPKPKRGSKKIGPKPNKKSNPYGKSASVPESRRAQSSKVSRTSSY